MVLRFLVVLGAAGLGRLVDAISGELRDAGSDAGSRLLIQLIIESSSIATCVNKLRQKSGRHVCLK